MFTSAMLEDKSIGLLLAIASSLAIGSSYVITKQGLQDASRRHGFDGDGHQYLKNPTWWAGMVMLVIGEGANFAAYAFAPAILVTPLGALSVLTGAVLGTYFLGEQLGVLGKLGCATCFIGSVLIASHAPPDKPIETVDEILNYAIQPGMFMKMEDPSPILYMTDEREQVFYSFAWSLAFFLPSWYSWLPRSTARETLSTIYQSALPLDPCQ